MQISFHSKLLGRLVLAMFLVSALGCEIDTRVSISDAHNPPTFKLSGNGILMTLFVYGPEASVNGFHKGIDEIKPIWKFNAPSSSQMIADLPLIKYRETPAGFVQVEPKQGPPPPIIEGQYYMLVPVSGNANWHSICFIVSGGKTQEESCN